MSDVKQVKVDNWGIYFLQRLKHFFNRTDYCDLTLQFQDNAQLKVHRLVLSACTEYFELLERTCEMYEDCLVMPDDLQADVVVPIVNFMYTGHLEFRMDLLERLYLTSQILNMPVLSKLLEAHRGALKSPAHSYGGGKRFIKNIEPPKLNKPTTSNKRSYSKAFDNTVYNTRDKQYEVYQPYKKPDPVTSPSTFRPPSPLQLESPVASKKVVLTDPRPTRYELPEELDNDNIFDNSFCNISYTCKPLMIHPETVKHYSAKRSGLFSEASSSKKLLPGTSTLDIVECKRITAKDDNIFDDNIPDHTLNDDLDMFQTSYNNDTVKDSNQLFDQILDDGPKVTIETKDSKVAANLDHAKIISEVLKKYPHLVKSNKNIKLKIFNTPSKGKKQQKASPTYTEEPEKPKPKLKTDEPDYTYETDVLDSQQAAKLIAMGAENTKGPWICLICGTPGKALHFTSYYKFRRHLVEVHNEKPVSNICEYCGLRSLKRNYLQHHLYSQHGVEPPPQYNFPKCNRCNYIALTEGLLVKHKMTHKEVKNFRCNVCSAPFNTTRQLLQHIQATGHKYSAERKTNLQCIYCLKGFLRDGNLYAHLKTYHKKEAKNDGIIEDSDDEKAVDDMPRSKMDIREAKFHNIKFEPSTSYDNDYEEVGLQYQVHQRHDGDLQLTPRKQHNVILSTKQKILNPGFGSIKPPMHKAKPARKPQPEPSNFLEDISVPSPSNSNNQNEDEIVLIDNIEYIMRDNQLIPRKAKPTSNEYIISDIIEPASLQSVEPTTSIGYTNVHNTKVIQEPSNMVVKKTTNINQPIQIVVSNEEEYKALMSSNHPILFDNGDANKTLTVLAAQHNSTLESATIDLNTTQPNDMMIIQEDFPLNVTEAVSTDNSNIVVVYSHPVDDQNKQFQILTTGGIGSQFVQSSAIITQNYETVTTSAPIMTAHEIETQPDTCWQENIQSADGQVQVDTQVHLQNVVENVEIKQHENQTSAEISELPDVHLGPVSETIVTQENEAIDTLNKLNAVNNECISQIVEQEIVEQSHNIPETQIATDILRESLIEQETIPVTEPTIQIAHTNIPEMLSNDINQETVVQEPMETENITETEIIPQQIISENHQTIEEIIPQEQAIDTGTVAQHSEIVENVALNNTLEEQQLRESQVYDDIVQINHIANETQTNPKEAVEKIQNLTSEWSEDEYDVPEDTPATVENLHKPEEVVTPHDHKKIDEVMENIQPEINQQENHVNTNIMHQENQVHTNIIQEETNIMQQESNIMQPETNIMQPETNIMQQDNHINTIMQQENHINTNIMQQENHVITNIATLTPTIESMPDVETEDSENSIPDDAVPSPEGPPMLPVIQSTVAPVQNDPQTQEKISSLLNDWEDNDSQEESTSDIPANEGKQEESNVPIENIPKTDNIKSLVSDWDDEEEEIIKE